MSCTNASAVLTEDEMECTQETPNKGDVMAMLKFSVEEQSQVQLTSCIIHENAVFVRLCATKRLVLKLAARDDTHMWVAPER